MFKVEEWFKEMANGNEEAFKFLKTFYFWVHKQDDLHDKDKPVFIPQATFLDLELINALTMNEFYRANHEFLWPVIVTSALSYIASEEWAKKDNPVDRIISQVLKSEYGNVMFATSYLTGGQAHALAMSRKYREYDFDHVRPESAG